MTYRIFTLLSYLPLGLDGPWTGPFALENRGPRDQGGSGKYYASRGTRPLGGAIHITAGIDDFVSPDLSAEATTDYGRTTTRDASWTGIVDSDSIINSLHPDRVAWVQGVPGYNFNRPLVGVEVGKRSPDWRNVPQAWVDATLENLAAYFAPFVVKYGWPVRLVTDRDEVQRLIERGEPVGFTYHWRLTPDTRSDPGRAGGVETFPWDRFAAVLERRVAQLRGESVDPLPPTPVSVVKGTVLEVTAARLNTRSGPSTTTPVIGGADRGVKITATGKVSGPWVEASTPWQLDHGVRSWWHSGYLRVVSQPKPPAPAVPPSGLPKGGVHVVRRGETVGGIASKYGTRTEVVALLSGLANPDRVEVGQRLFVAWVIGRGDTLGAIASRFRVSLSELVRANRHITNPDRVDVGDLVRIP